MTDDIYNEVLVKKTITIAARTNGTVNGTGVDLYQSGLMFQQALVVVYTGTLTDGSIAIEVQESADNSTFTAVADADLQGTEPTIAASADDTVYEIGYLGSKRYLRVVAVSSGTTTGGVFGAVIVLAKPRVKSVR